MHYETAVEINAAAADVWAAMVDVERWPEWTDSMQRVEHEGDGDLTVGSRVRIKQPRLPAVTWRVTELDPGRSFSWTATSTGVTTLAEHRLVPIDPSAVTVHLAFRQSGPLAGLVAVFLARLTRRYVDMEATGLRRRFEGR